MSEVSIPYPELLALFIALSDGSISDADFARLDAVLAGDAQARAFYLEFMRTSTMLEQRARAQVQTGDDGAGLAFGGFDQESDAWSLKDVEGLLAPPTGGASMVDLTDELTRRKREAKEAAARRRRVDEGRRSRGDSGAHRPFVVPKSVVWLGFAAALLLAGVLISIRARTPATDSSVAVPPDPAPRRASPWTPPPVATLTYTDGAVWVGGPLAVGDRLSPGAVRLESGVAHVLLDCGAVVMLRGPVEVDLNSRWEAFLAEGQVVARVPERAHGFKVVGEGFVVTDLGTEFAVRVGDDGVRCRVVLGAVEVALTGGAAPGGAVERLTENHGVAIEVAEGRIRGLAADEADDLAWALPYAADLNRELVVNGGFENGAIGAAHTASRVDVVAIPGWEGTDPGTVLGYQQAGVETDVGFPDPRTDAVPADRGEAYYFSRYPGTMTQGVDLSGLSALTDAGQARYVFSADLGGYITQNDRALVAVVFLDAAGRELSRADLEPVDAAARGGRTGFIHRSSSDALPAGTRSARVEVTGVRHIGGFCDGFADNISLVVQADSSQPGVGQSSPSPRVLQTAGGHAGGVLCSNSFLQPAVSRVGRNR